VEDKCLPGKDAEIQKKYEDA